MGDENKRKYFDIAPPLKPSPKDIVDLDDRPSNSPPPAADGDKPNEESIDADRQVTVVDTLMEPEEVNESEHLPVSHQANTVQPPSVAEQNGVEGPEVTADSTGEAEKASPDNQDAISEPVAAPEPEDKDTPAPVERFSVTDSLPDPGEQTAEAAKADMQDPKLYDTKQYYVPIGNAHHKHGHTKGAFVFGIICAVVVVGAVVLIMWQLGK